MLSQFKFLPALFPIWVSSFQILINVPCCLHILSMIFYPWIFISMAVLPQVSLSSVRKLPGLTYHMGGLLIPSNLALFSLFLTFTCFLIICFVFGNNFSFFQIAFVFLCQIFTNVFTNFVHDSNLYFVDSESSHSTVAFRHIPLPNRHALCFVQFMDSLYTSFSFTCVSCSVHFVCTKENSIFLMMFRAII